MNLTELSFTYRKSVLMLVALLLVNGVFAYFTLPAQEDPTITIREAIVSTAYPGMATDRVEQLITKRLEEEIRKIPEVKKLFSSSATGLSTIHVKIYDRYFNLDDIWQDLRNKVQQAQKDLPDGTYPSVVNDEFGDVAVLTLALTADGFSMADMYDMAKHIRDTMYAVDGSKKIEILGQQQERIYLEVSNAKLAQLGISPTQLLAEMRNQNIINSGGQIDTGSKSYVIEPTGSYETLEDISDSYITIPGTQDAIALKDIVTVSRGYVDPPEKPAYFNGQPAIFFAVSMLPGYNILEYSPRLKAKISDIQNSLPIGFQLNIATDQSEQVTKTVRGVSVNVLQTLAIVLVVVILFLGMRTGLIVGAIVPCVMLASLTIMQMMDIKLERMSLATLIISLGLLVDNGIVIAEDFKRRLEQGAERMEALIQCGKELSMPLLSSSATTVLFFLPLMLAEHVAGEYTRSISLVILITLLASWVLALCVTPTLCYFFIRLDCEPKVSLTDKLFAGYRGFLHWVLSHKGLFMGAMVVLFVMAIGSMKFMPKQFFPDSDRPQILVNIDLPNGSSARQTNRQMQDIFQWLKSEPGFDYIESFSGYVGFSGPRFVLSLNPEDPAANKGFIVLNIRPGEDLAQLALTLDRQIEMQFPNVSARVKKMFLGPSDSNTIKIQVKGPDKDVIYANANKIMDILHQVPNTMNIRSDWENRTTKIEVLVDQHRARRAGITSKDIAGALKSYFSGSMVTEFREGDEVIPIMMRAGEVERNNLDRLRTITIYSESTGRAVPLFQVAEFAPVHQYSIIRREDMFRTVSVEARNAFMTAEDLKKHIDTDIQALNATLPLNHHIEYDGVITESAAAQKALMASVPMVIGLIIMLLVMQFNSFRRPLVIVLTIPLSFVGAIIGLWVMGAPFGFMVSLGLYSLAGIIINNAIVLIDRINIEKAEGKSDYDAIVEACMLRLRPITMTTITTIMGLLPLIISQDALFYGLASAIAFGLGIGTLFTLGVVPVLYAWFFRVKNP